MELRNLKVQEQTQADNLRELSNEASRILEILDQIEEHTAELRKRLVAELKPKSEAIQIKLDAVE